MLIESYATISENAHIQGVALIPRISRNNNLYTKEELARFHGKKVPLNWEHDPQKVIGEVQFQYDPESETVYYEGNITDPSAALLAKNKLLYTSIEATPTAVKQICNSDNDCFSMPFGLIPEALALTETPGIPETSVNVLRESINQTIKKLKEHGDFSQYGATDTIHKTIHMNTSGSNTNQIYNWKADSTTETNTVDNIMQDKFANMTSSLEKQIKQKEEALELFKKIASENNDPIVSTQVEMIENDILVLTNQLIGLRKDSEFISVEHTLEHIVDNLKEQVLCDCCGELKKKNK